MPRFDRLLRAAEVIEMPRNISFDMGAWKRTTKCGTVCCAFGKFVEIDQPKELSFLDHGDSSSIYYLENGVATHSGYGAAKEYFEIDYDVAAFFFCPSKYNCDSKITEKMVADRIREWVANNCVIQIIE